MRHTEGITSLRSGSCTPPPHTRYFPSFQREPTAEWILGLLEHEDVSTSISIDESVLRPDPVHPLHKNKWFLRQNRYRTPPSPKPVLRRSSSTSQLDIEKLKENNALSLQSKPKWWSITKLHKSKVTSRVESIDVQSGYKLHYGNQVHSLQLIKQRWSSRLHLLKRSLSNRILLKRPQTFNVSGSCAVLTTFYRCLSYFQAGCF